MPISAHDVNVKRASKLKNKNYVRSFRTNKKKQSHIKTISRRRQHIQERRGVPKCICVFVNYVRH